MTIECHSTDCEYHAQTEPFCYRTECVCDTDPVPPLMAKIIDLERELQHWKANHDNRVEAARVLIERTDLPLERVTAYRNYIAMQSLVARLWNALIYAEAYVESVAGDSPEFVEFLRNLANIRQGNREEVNLCTKGLCNQLQKDETL